LRRLSGQTVADPVLRIEPVGGRYLGARTERYQDAVGHIALCETRLGGFRTVHFEVEARLVEELVNVGIHRAGDFADFCRHLLRDGEIALHVVTYELDVNRGGETEIQDLAHDVGRLEKEFDAGEFARQFRAQLRDEVGGRVVVLGIEGHKNFSVRRPDRGVVAVGRVDAAIG
jgi:hypothetical protein